MSLEDSYRTYREVLAAAIRISRPDVDVQSIELDVLKERVRNFKPHLVICSLPATADPEGVPGWVELSLDLSRPTIICIRGHRVEQSNRMGLEQMLNVIDEVERLTLRD